MSSNFPARKRFESVLRLETFVHLPWVITVIAQKGKGHSHRKQPYQDAVVVDHAGDILIIALADGVSSVRYGKEGADLATAAAVLYLKSEIVNQTPDTDMLHRAVNAAAAELLKASEAAACAPSQFATTLVLCVITEDVCYSAVIGDSSLIGIYSPRGEFDIDVPPRVELPPELAPLASAPMPNDKTTHYLPSPMWSACLTTNATLTQNLRGIIAASDGGQNFFTDADEGDRDTFKRTFVDPLQGFHTTVPPRQMAALWGRYIFTSEALNDDDRTIVIAYCPVVEEPELIKSRDERA